MEVEQGQQLLHHVKVKEDVDSGHRDGQEEHHQNLAVDGCLYLAPAEAHLLHDFKTGLVLVALRDLLVVDNQHCRQQEDEAQEDTQKQESARQAVDLRRPLKAQLPLAGAPGAGTVVEMAVLNGILVVRAQGFQRLCIAVQIQMGIPNHLGWAGTVGRIL